MPEYDYFDEDVSNATSEELGALIKLRIRNYHSVQVFRKARKVILRTWRVDFEVKDVKGTDLPS